MNFELDEAMEVLERTPRTLAALLSGLDAGWLTCNEGEGTWNAIEVVDHLVEAEKTNWIPRLEWLLREGESRPFPPFDRYAHLTGESGNAIEDALFEFQALRSNHLGKLKALLDADSKLERRGLHPAFGLVTAKQLVSTWAVHDLTHTAQIVRVMANRYAEDVGPWREYLGILK